MELEWGCYIVTRDPRCGYTTCELRPCAAVTCEMQHCLDVTCEFRLSMCEF
ncbi:hypothetical protein E2C01_068021 [Portunus trituberculatus]|uniref:Uncharacterized protein n=1 Tax=Portunus trituberculatus TaxID=210409 RepID=A0A5B7HV73_PORTR|nr:hypothetical protein [Portunus trituberculatus]